MKKFKLGLALFVCAIIIGFGITKVQDIKAASDVGICNQITANGGHDDECGEGQITFVNSSFEEPKAAANSYTNVNEINMPGWETTNGRNIIELWTSPFAASYTGSRCHDGDQCVEINANEPASLYQDFKVKPGQYISYSFYHMGRTNSTEKLELRIGKPNDGSDNKLNPTMGGVNDKVIESSARKGVWQQRSGFYQVPADFGSDGNTTLRIAFLATTSSSLGNIIDTIEFRTKAVYDNDLTIAMPAGGAVDATTDVFHVNNVFKFFDRDTLSNSKSTVTYDLSPNVDYVPGSLKVEGVAHSDVTYADGQLVVSNLPEKYEDINIEYDIMLNEEPNVANIQISSRLDYASRLVVNNFPNYDMYYVTDNSNLNVTYNNDGYCSEITANNGYSDDCAVPSNSVYDNIVDIVDNQPTSSLDQKIFTIENDLVNLNTDKDLDESTAKLEYVYTNNMIIDFSTLKINGVTHTDYTLTPGVKANTLVLNNLPDVGTSDYKITYDMTFDFTSPTTGRDVFVRSFNITSTLKYMNEATSSYVSSRDQVNLQYATEMKLTSSLADASGNNLLATSEVLKPTITVKNDSPLTTKNVVVRLVTDSSKLENDLSNVVVKRGTETLALNTDYAIVGNEIHIPQMVKGELLEISYELIATDFFDSEKRLENTISVVSDEFTNGSYLLQTMPIDIVGSTSIIGSMTVTDNHNGFAGNYEELEYVVDLENTGSYTIPKIKIFDEVINDVLDLNTMKLEIYDNNGTLVSPTKYTFANNTLTYNGGLLPGEKLKIRLKIKTIADVGLAVIDNIFDVVATAKSGVDLPSIEVEANIDVSDNPVITVTDFVKINVGDTFNVKDYASAIDTEDGTVTDLITYSPVIDTSKPGVRKISVKVEDSDRRSDVKTMVVVVDDGNFYIGTDKIIYAKDFQKYISQVVVTPEAVKTAASATVFNKSNGEATGETVNVDLGSYKAVSGTYPIKFTVASEPTVTRTVTATVLKGNPPSIDGATFKEIPVGTSFDPKAGVTSNDDFDGNLTSKITVSGTYDVNTPGIYKLTYRVEDADKNVTTKNRILLVNDGNYTAGNTYIIYSENFTRRVGEVKVEQDAVIQASNTKAYDKQTGERVTRKKTVEFNAYTNVVGDYPISISIVEDPTEKRDIIASVVTGDLPELNVPEFTELTVGSSFAPKAGITATDTEDVDLNSYINFTGTVDTSKPGIYVLEYNVTDSDMNTVYEKRVVLVNDGNYKVGDSKIIYAKDFYKLSNEVDTSDAAIILDASAKLYEKSTGALSSEQLIVTKNGYSATNDIYPIEFTIASDSLVSRTVNATVSDGHDPVINAKPFVEMPINSKFIPDFGTTAYDIEDGDITADIVASGNVDTTVAGVYIIDYSVSDATGNQATAKTIVLVNDGTYYAGENQIIHAESFSNLISEVDTTDGAIITDASAELFSKLTGESLGTSDIVVNKGTYDAIPGKYNIIFSSSSDSSAVITSVATVNKGLPPILTVPNFTEIQVGDEFYAGNYAEANDPELGDITTFIEYTHDVDPNTPGFYHVLYTVADLDGNEASKTMTVLVNDGTYVVGNSFVIQAHDYTLRVSQVSLNTTDINTAADVKVYQKQTGVEQAVGYKTTYTDYNPSVGTYDIDFTVDVDLQAKITIQANVVPGNPPIISGEKVTEVPINGTFDRQAGIEAYDIEDGDVSAEGRIDGFANTNVAGIYKLVYYVTDSDGNYTEFNRYVVVNDGTFLVTDKRLIRARDFTLRVSEVNQSQTAIDSNTEFAVFDIETESQISLPYTLNIGEYRPEVGEYDIDYLIEDDEEIITKDIDATVIAGNAPEITTEQYLELDLNDPFDIYSDVTAFDIEDNDITSEIVASTNLDTSQIGVYTVSYSVTDSDNNVTTFLKVITVGKEQHSVGDRVIIYADGFTRYVSEVDDSDQGIIDASGFKVYSKTTGEEISSFKPPTITTDYQAVAGEYPTVFTMEIDETVSHEIIAEVISGEAPEIIGDEVVSINVGQDFVISDFITATDLEDGDITSQVVVTGDFDPNTHGVYEVTYEVTDKDNNTSSFTQVIVVNDGNYTILDQTIMYAVDFTRTVSKVNTSDLAVTSAAQFKVYDKTRAQLITDQTPEIITDYQSVIGEYDVTFKIGDDRVTIVATVTSGEKPVISGDSIVDINLGDNFFFKDYITATDKEDGDITKNVVISGQVNTDVHGVYPVTYTVTDADQNTTTFKQTIIINDGNYYIIGDYIVYKKDFEIALEDVEVDKDAIIKSSGLIVYNIDGTIVDPSLISIDFNGYKKAAGTYQVIFTINGTEIPVNIKVVDDSTDTTDTTTPLGIVRSGLKNYLVYAIPLIIILVVLKIIISKRK